MICTVAIPVYNRKNKSLNYVALESALAQRLRDMEIVVVDDCSTDGTWEVLQTYHDSRLRLVRNERNLGLFGNFNRSLQLAQGKYICFLCSDDKLHPNCLTPEIEMMEQHENVVLLSTYGRRVDEHGNILGMQANHFPPGIYDGESAITGALWFQATMPSTRSITHPVFCFDGPRRYWQGALTLQCACRETLIIFFVCSSMEI